MGKGTLYLVATPIGNLQDITLRALEVLRKVDLVVAEDTRKAMGLLNHFGIRKRTLSFHKHSPPRRVEEIVEHLKEGKEVALISEAGTPGISDPGEEVVRRCAEEGIRTVPIPGPSALTSALSVSGFCTQRFVFEAFLPRKKGKRRKLLEKLKEEERTIVFFEAPHRLEETLVDLLDIIGNRRLAICRELTKIHEEIFRGNIEEALKWARSKEIKGEITIILEGKPPSP